MVRSLVPGFSRSSATPRPADGTPQTRASPGASNQTWKPPNASPKTYSGTLGEALRNNPFGNTWSRPSQLSTPTSEQQQEQDELNTALETLVHIFPDVRIEVFRELLVRFDGNSRTQVCVEELLRHKKKWVSGRWNIQESEQEDSAGTTPEGPIHHDSDLVPPHERFRSSEYKTAVRTALVKEFNGLNNSTVEAVLAEVNFSYARARPTLLDLSRRTWRATFNNILPFRRKKDRETHPLMVWHRDPNGELVPGLKETGSSELDAEIHETMVAPLLRQRREEQEGKDFRFASDLNEKEAQAVDALYECECCFADVTFEQIATCSSNTHIICYHCIQRTVSEALFGQGWGKSVDLERSSLKCLAPLSVGSCEGSLDPQIVKQAILLDTAGFETYRKFEDRLSSETLMKSQLKLIRCPFCSYAEIDPVYHPSSRGVCWRLRRDAGILPTVLMVLLILDLVPLLVIPVLILLVLEPATVTAVFGNAIRNLCLKIRPKRFKCANPVCLRISCMTCQKPWRDPHVCHEPLLLDLRATVEAARTAAVKRTCPRCCLSFVKSSGCNKLTCVCGYSMCYLCRKALGPPMQAFARPRHEAQDGAGDPEDPMEDGNASDDEFEETEGYKHFCEHFRINPGSRCTECTKCNLYQAEDEEAVARRAGEKAEREWRIRQGDAGTNNPIPVASRSINQDLSAGGDQSTRRPPVLHWDMQLISGRPWGYWLGDVWLEGRWKLEGQALADWIVERIVVVEDV
ncbi:unnamed protein product [Penicillium salamii]|uniref:RING-type domain-containing protein n=1 Tax=Penicillium salamii TaxID=1612424 RepID=A0A9W4NXU2_9EURO|nr:unnamed protein product [Penicillium salamii]CAG8274013.1 unnamed protein product [Penicillium salamii]CAG8297946.1 unnamed protein product [Penicillium salamii]CAG8378714.1 unnamed protein product [Penicillium salamii]CAG8401303.1 unnamed protein product [Penicillium salamii]